MRTAIVDDRADDREFLAKELYGALRERGYGAAAIDAYEGGEQLLEAFDRGSYDLIFLDIYMKGINGIETGAEIRKKDRDVRLVFITTSNDFAAESYSLRADYYLLKPFSREDILRALDCIDLSDFERKRVAVLPDGSEIPLHDILYSEYFNHRITIHLINGRKKKLRASQLEMEKLLCANDFFATSMKGMIVNLEYVQRIDEGMIYLEEGHCLPVSRRRSSDIRRAHAAILFRSVRKS